MRPLDPVVVEVLRDAYARTGSLRLVGRVYDLSPNTVRSYVDDLGVNTQELVESLRSTDDLLIGTYVGLWMGDGTQYREQRGKYTVKICCNADCVELNVFIRQLLLDLFGKRSSLFCRPNSKSAVLQFYSRFIFSFINTYVLFEENKTHSVRLRHVLLSYSRKFIEGCFLGLMLSDGSLKQQLRFNVTSFALSENMMELLSFFGFHPKRYVRYNTANGRKDLYLVWLGRVESRMASGLLDRILNELGCDTPFVHLKEGR